MGSKQSHDLSKIKTPFLMKIENLLSSLLSPFPTPPTKKRQLSPHGCHRNSLTILLL
jgi:hypothetical protein